MARAASVLVAASFAVLLGACSQEPEGSAAAPQPPAAPQSPPAAAPPQAARAPTQAPSSGGIPDVIVAERGGFIPEGIEYDQANRRFLTGSLAEGTIFVIGNDGSVTPFVEDPE